MWPSAMISGVAPPICFKVVGMAFSLWNGNLPSYPYLEACLQGPIERDRMDHMGRMFKSNVSSRASLRDFQ